MRGSSLQQVGSVDSDEAGRDREDPGRLSNDLTNNDHNAAVERHFQAGSGHIRLTDSPHDRLALDSRGAVTLRWDLFSAATPETKISDLQQAWIMAKIDHHVHTPALA